MKEKNFFKNVLKAAGITALGVLPRETKDGAVPKQIEPISISTEIPTTKEVEQKTAKYQDFVKKEKEPEHFISKEKLSKIVAEMRESAAKQVPRDVKDHYNAKYNYGKKMPQHDHEILAFGSKGSLNIDYYNKIINKAGDSLYYTHAPKVSFENYLKDRGYELPNEENRKKWETFFEQEKTEIPNRYKDMSFDNYLKESGWLDQKRMGELQSDYGEELKDTHSMVKENHPGSTAYALLRSGIYDQWKKEGGRNADLADKIIEDINNPTYYKHDTTVNEKNSILTGTHFGQTNQVEWIMATWLELAKRNIKPVFNRGGEKTEPYTIEELTASTQKRLEYALDTNKREVKKKIYTKYPESKDPWIKEEAPPGCEGTHALHALVMYDLYSKDSTKLSEHLLVAKNMLKKILEEESSGTAVNTLSRFGGKLSIKEDSSQYVTLMLHNLSHGVLPFTELPDDFKLNPETKALVQESIQKLVEYSEIFKEKFDKNDVEVATLAHIIDTLEHLPKCVLEK